MNAEIDSGRDLEVAFRQNRLTPSEVVDRSLRAIADDPFGAFIEVREGQARAEAEAADARYKKGSPLSPLDGVPIAVKANIAVKGYRRSGGIRNRNLKPVETDALAVRRLRLGGAVVIGTTNLPSAAIGATTRNRWSGVTSNPIAADRDAGGSSGGSAAAVAAGYTPIAIGSDTLGSVRIPASFTGTAGLKPSRGLIPTAGLMELEPVMDTIGPIARAIVDISTVLAIMSADRRSDSHPDRLSSIGILDTTKTQLSGSVEEVFAGVLESLQETGIKVTRVDLGVDLADVRLAGLIAVETNAYRLYWEEANVLGNGFTDDVIELLRYGSQLSSDAISDARELMKRCAQTLDCLLGSVDLVVTPTSPSPASLLSEGENPLASIFTALASVSGHPAMTIPVTTGGGLPVGIQLIGAHGQDQTVIERAAHIEGILNG